MTSASTTWASSLTVPSLQIPVMVTVAMVTAMAMDTDTVMEDMDTMVVDTQKDTANSKEK
jgi:Ca2+/H+ antiporter